MLARYAVSSIIVVAIVYIISAPPFGLMSVRIDVGSVNRCFLYGLVLLIIGAFAYVMRTGFLNPIVRGASSLGSMFTATSNALREEERRLQADTSLQQWKLTVSRKLSAYALGSGSGMLLGAIILQIQYF
ncbi:DUF3899 domain-containing protein [Paenibacillus alvei]|uniref:DUF3899 domain-containing protein n=1 Tax=Paenibacillus alvei TaxID=44250 RepID=A0A383R9D8_PAEAL|nr:DUF3899 domain-containing protein [Paenibacillus alvei]SYX83540.1 conserved membrane protein of unknown function [Paenibacillus alvei]